MMSALFSKSRLVVFLLFFGCSALLVMGVSARKLGLFSRSPQAIRPGVKNRTSSVRISNVQQLTNGDVEVTLVNQSTRAIYAYTILTSEEPIRKGVTTYATVAPVAPGESKAERIPANNLKSGSVTSRDGAGEIVFSAVYLEGGTAEGDLRESEKLKETMAGMKEQAIVALQILRTAGASREQDSGRLLDTVESQAVSMSVKDESPHSSREGEFGRATVNDRLLGEIKKLRTRKASPGLDVKDQLLKLIPYYERLAQKL